MKKIEWIPVILMPLFCFLLCILTCSMEMGWSWETLKSAAFIRRFVMTTACTMSTYISAQYARNRSNHAKQEYTATESTIKQIVMSAGSDLTEFLRRYNLRKKLSMYREKLDRKIASVEHHVDRIRERGKKETPKLRRLDDRIILLQSKRDTATEETVSHHKVRGFSPIKRVQLYGIAGHSRGESEDIIREESFFARKGVSRVMRGTMTSFALTALTIEPLIALDMTALISVLSCTFSICTAILSGIRVADTAYTEISLSNQNVRISVLKQYEDWRKKEM